MADFLFAEMGVHVPIAVVVDSNAIWNRWWLDDKSWEALKNLGEQGRIALHVPEVVVQEVVRGRRHDANELVSELAKLRLPRIERLLQLGLPTDRRDLTAQVQERVRHYDTELRSRLGELGAVIVPIPGVSHRDVLTRALEGRRPFDGKGRNGYRDVLIWHSVLDVAANSYPGVVFVTDNTRDFCASKSSSLLPDLLAEIVEISPHTVAVVASTVAEVGARVDELELQFAPVKHGEVADDEEPILFKPPGNEDIRDALNHCGDVIAAGVTPRTPGRWGADLADGWDFSTVLEEDPREVASIDFDFVTLACEPSSGDWAEFTATVEAEVTLDGFAYKSDIYGDEPIEIQDADWNDHYMHVLEHHSAELTFQLVLGTDGITIEECWLAHSREGVSASEPELVEEG